ncbi:MAG: molybdopterin converting factor subunit 1 [Rhodospirillaceae bacterium]|nr:molybdopterin converting factor subunit 1 [Rhodospirillaceae bacterium]
MSTASLTVLYFAWVKEKVGLGTETVSPPASVVTVSDLIDWLARRSPGHAAAFADRKLIKAAVDQVHAPLSSELGGAREVAFFPPVTGG